ncbi:MAG: ParB N-terminal domain-containing protein [Candidatus Methylumidiphilus sp.]
MAEQKIQMIPTAKLDFDPDNPRFYRMKDAHDIQAIIEKMLDVENLPDLMRSIGQNGYFASEPLVVIKALGENYTVVEGNRRLAAVKLLNKELLPPKRRTNSIAEIMAGVIVTPPIKLPCLVFASQREILQGLGYRHITGIQDWDSLSKAKYLVELRDALYSQLPRVEQLRSMANSIGSSLASVAQLLTGLALYEKAENCGFFGLPINATDIGFSYITTALNYRTICAWLGLESRTDMDMLNLNEENLRHMFAWMFSKDQQGWTILGETRNLRVMAAVVASPEAIKALIDTGRLDEAYLYTEGSQAALEQAMGEADQKLRVVWNMLLRKQPITQGHLSQAEGLFEVARLIRNSLREKLED